MLKIVMAKNLVFHAWSKHIKIHHQYIGDTINKEDIYLKFINDQRLTNTFTKVVTSEKFNKLLNFILF